MLLTCLSWLKFLLSMTTVGSRESSKIFVQPWGSYIGPLHVRTTKARVLKNIIVFLKTQGIKVQYRGTHEVFLQNAKTSQYAWNRAPIDITHIIRCVASVGREFPFLLDVELLQNPTTLNQGNFDMYEYL